MLNHEINKTSRKKNNKDFTTFKSILLIQRIKTLYLELDWEITALLIMFCL